MFAKHILFLFYQIPYAAGQSEAAVGEKMHGT